MGGVTQDEVANAFMDLAVIIREALRNIGASTRPAIHGDQAAQIVAAACHEVSNRLLRGDYGP